MHYVKEIIPNGFSEFGKKVVVLLYSSGLVGNILVLTGTDEGDLSEILETAVLGEAIEEGSTRILGVTHAELINTV